MGTERFDFDKTQSQTEPTKLLYITTSQFNADWHSTPHTHNTCELFYCIHGKGQFYINGQVFNVCKNDIVIINSHIMHTELSLPNDPLEYIVFGIDKADFEFDKDNCGYFIINCNEISEELNYFLHILKKEMKYKVNYSEIICQHLVDVILIWLKRSLDLKIDDTITKLTNKESAIVRRYIDEHYSENITLDLLAEMTHVSKFYLSHIFKKDCGISPINYVIARRIHESMSMLKSTDYTVSQISMLLGFSSLSHFSQCFKQNANMSPSEYRKTVKKNTDKETIKNDGS